MKRPEEIDEAIKHFGEVLNFFRGGEGADEHAANVASTVLATLLWVRDREFTIDEAHRLSKFMKLGIPSPRRPN